MVVQYFKKPLRYFPGLPEDIHEYYVRILNCRAAILIRGVLNTQQDWYLPCSNPQRGNLHYKTPQSFRNSYVDGLTQRGCSIRYCIILKSFLKEFSHQRQIVKRQVSVWNLWERRPPFAAPPQLVQQTAIDRTKATRRFNLDRPLIAPRLPAYTTGTRTRQQLTNPPYWKPGLYLIRKFTIGAAGAPSPPTECAVQLKRIFIFHENCDIKSGHENQPN